MQTNVTRTVCRLVIGVGLGILGPAASPLWAQDKPHEDVMSAMGRRAAHMRAMIAASPIGKTTVPLSPGLDNDAADDGGTCGNLPDCPESFPDGPDNTQSETSIAVDRTGRYVVVGFNDFRGFAKSPVSVSGYMYSQDGGQTFTDGGQLPVTTGTGTVGTVVLPQVFGDPDVKYLGGCTFVYSSILVKKISALGTAQTMGVHRSTDCGQTWSGPYEVQPATNPGGLLISQNAADDADKEFMDVDPDTGRLMMTWTNFGTTSVQIRSAVSDDGGVTWPLATSAIIADGDADGQASIPRFARGSDHVYVSWRRFPSPGTLFGYGNITAVARSTDNGLTWEPPIELSDEFLTADLILGNDRSNTSPSLAVDRSNGPHRGSVYVVYANNDSRDGSDIVFQRSRNGGETFSSPILINARPGQDRAQWFPWVTVDDATGRVVVYYYDQGIATSGDLSEVSYLFSNDGGRTWEHPRPLTARPFHAGHGNDTGQPNLGDYIQAVSHAGRTYFAYAVANRPPLGFVDGQPQTSLTPPDVQVSVLSAVDYEVPHAPVSLQSVSSRAKGGAADPGEAIILRLPLFNYATNPLYARALLVAVGVLTTDTPNVRITNGIAAYPRIAPGDTRANAEPYELRLASGFVPGTPIELQLRVLSSSGVTVLRHTLFTGTPVTMTLLRENFDNAAPATLPAGWTTSHGGGATVVPWTTSNTFCGPSNGAFHQNANDGAGASPLRFERLFSPAFTVPTGSDYVDVEFDVCYNTEDDPILPTTAYDGFLLRVTDLTTGRTLRSVLAEAFADEFTTGDVFHYPKHLPRSGNAAYFQDMSAWAGDSGGMKHVHMRLPGMAGSTAQLRFEFTQDSNGTCQDVRPDAPRCGVFVDNITVTNVVAAAPAPRPDRDEEDDSGRQPFDRRD